ncbi:MAG TPA: phosphatidate cytidylyltransferase [Armatimonadota bacterium]|nr:phosphatidate cytidylyltransferase [Armatimonadota bacterium]
MFRQRALSAAIGLPILYGLIFLDGYPWAHGLPLLAVVMVVSMLGAEEFRLLLCHRGFHPPKDLGKMMGMLPPLFPYFYHYDYNDLVLLALTIVIVVDVLMVALALIGDISRRALPRGKPSAPVAAGNPPAARKAHEPPPPGGPLGAVRDFVLVAVGALYIGGLLSCLIFLRRVDPDFAAPWGVWPVALLIAAVWIADTAAFAAGKLLDGRKLWPRLSPGKTIIGTIAGIAACAIVFAVAAAVEVVGAEGGAAIKFGAIAAVLGVGAVVGVAGLGGDLAESALKRWAGVKDSGDIIRGHGGVLDRFDSLLWAAPAFLYILVSWYALVADL